eukprot:159407-Pleurochrysis_carterae.AAC.1
MSDIRVVVAQAGLHPSRPCPSRRRRRRSTLRRRVALMTGSRALTRRMQLHAVRSPALRRRNSSFIAIDGSASPSSIDGSASPPRTRCRRKGPFEPDCSPCTNGTNRKW